ncbi:RidA family protein [Agromyces binzhouensis]|uniref:RidA family protein n=1 Tax=Agromyces binzhouensis TaxID=1817495 RepID=UPI00362D34E1
MVDPSETQFAVDTHWRTRLEQLGRTLPVAPEDVAAYRPAVRSGDVVHTSGQLPFVGGAIPSTGHVGDNVSVEDAQEMAAQCAMNALAAAVAAAGGRDLRRIIKVVGYVASRPDFTGQSTVIDGASQLLGDVFGLEGVHARSAIGVAALPLGAPVEVELVIELRPQQPEDGLG